MTAATLLIELLTEELPPKALAKLAGVFSENILVALGNRGLVDAKSTATFLATPRRIAARITEVSASAPDSEKRVTGPSTKAAAQAVAGFAKKHSVEVDKLDRIQSEKGEVFAARLMVKGAVLDEILAGIVEQALKSLPIPKLMRWGSGDAQFVRPVHGLVMLHGNRIVPGTVLGLSSSNRTCGHRFMGKGGISLATADEYERKLLDEGMVVAGFANRRALIDRELKADASRQGATLGEYEDLLDEVTALVEHPSVYVGGFDKSYLEVPQECLILTMRQNQKYFPLFDAAGKLLPKFLIVSNMQVADPRHIVGGNERVVRPRLEDARFFYDQDRKRRLEERVPQLARVIYHNKLGTQLERVERLQLLSGHIARELEADAALAERAAWLSKADLLTGMVGEFPELQGVMGRYYALHDGEPAAVADAIEAHYRPRFAGDRLPESPVACAVALADKFDALAGLFGIRQTPTGDKDPFGLRRAALGIVRILVERDFGLSLHDIVNHAFSGYDGKIGDAHIDVHSYIFERLASYLRESGYSTLEVESVVSLTPRTINLVPRQLEAVRAFNALPEAESLAAANKRVINILKQASAKGESFVNADEKFLKESAERALFNALKNASQKATLLFDRGDFSGYLKTFAVLKAPVDAFFDSVTVMATEPELRRNRLALLTDLRDAMNRIADISKLAK